LISRHISNNSIIQACTRDFISTDDVMKGIFYNLYYYKYM